MSISFNQIVKIIPSVIATGTNPLSMNAVLIDNTAATPFGSLLEFSSQAEVADFFGTESIIYELAGNYFKGFNGCTKTPSNLFVTAYAKTPRSAWLKGRSIAGMTIAQLKAIKGSLKITIDGVDYKTDNVDFSQVNNFTEAAAAIATQLRFGNKATINWDSLYSKFVINSATTGNTSTITYAEGTAADDLGLANGVLSQGANVDTPASCLDRIVSLTENWSTLITTFNPDSPATENTQKELFAKWMNNSNYRYLYVAWDNTTAALTKNNPQSFGSLMADKDYSGVFVVYNNANVAAFVAGMIASIDWDRPNGRITGAFKSQEGLAVTTASTTDADAILSNNTSYYGKYKGAGENEYNILYDGAISGGWMWLDTYVNQIFLNNQLQNYIMAGLVSANSVPYNDEGKTLIRAWCIPPIRQALQNGSIRTGVTLSEAQKLIINQAAGVDITTELETAGFYLQVGDATPSQRQYRQSPPINFWYTDGGSVQKISMASIAVL